MSKYFIYCRKSSEAEDRQVLSIDSQVSEIRQLAGKMNIGIADVLTEAQSAKEPGRRIFNAMMQRLYRGEAQGILCWKLDRLARNPVDGGAIIWAIKQHGIRIVTPFQSFSQSEDNVILMYIEFGMAQKYVDDLSKNVKRGLRTKAENGWFPAPAPLGYLNVRSESGEKRLVKDPDRFPLIRRIWDTVLTGAYSVQQVLDLANKEWGFRTRPTRKTGGKPLARSAIYRLLTDPFYCGWYEYPRGSGQWHQGKHESMVTQSEFDQVQLLLGRTGNPRPQRLLEFTYTGLISCGECGAGVTAEEKVQLRCTSCRRKFACRNQDRCPGCGTLIENMPNRRIRRYVYYHCTKRKNPRCSQRSVEQADIDRQFDTFLTRIEIRPNVLKCILGLINTVHHERVASEAAVRVSRQNAYAECVKRLDNLVRLKTCPQNADGSLLSDEEYGRQRFELLQEKARFEGASEDISRSPGVILTGCKETLEFAAAARMQFKDGDASIKKTILAATCSNLTLIDKKLIIEAKKPFDALEQSQISNASRNPVIEPGNGSSVDAQDDRSASSYPRMLAFRDDVRTTDPDFQKIAESIYAFLQETPFRRFDPPDSSQN